MIKSSVEVAREYQPLDQTAIHGVTFDGRLVWFARDGELVAFDPTSERVVRRFEVPGARGGTAFDGTHLYQLAGEVILVLDPEEGRIVRRLPAPNRGENSGMAWSDGYLWVGQYRAAKIHKLDAQTGELLKTLSSDRFVTGVSCVDGALWHAVSGGGDCELRRLAADGNVEEVWSAPVPGISGMEATSEGFWCGGEQGKLRLLQKR
ncbi:MAG: WD40-like repeat protein [Myxococcaceae bacterium]|nr:WD40-like repeat protein [Myxococcaceae bacterium]